MTQLFELVVFVFGLSEVAHARLRSCGRLFLCLFISRSGRTQESLPHATIPSQRDLVFQVLRLTFLNTSSPCLLSSGRGLPHLYWLAITSKQYKSLTVRISSYSFCFAIGLCTCTWSGISPFPCPYDSPIACESYFLLEAVDLDTFSLHKLSLPTSINSTTFFSYLLCNHTISHLLAPLQRIQLRKQQSHRRVVVFSSFVYFPFWARYGVSSLLASFFAQITNFFLSVLLADHDSFTSSAFGLVLSPVIWPISQSLLTYKDPIPRPLLNFSTLSFHQQHFLLHCVACFWTSSSVFKLQFIMAPVRKSTSSKKSGSKKSKAAKSAPAQAVPRRSSRRTQGLAPDHAPVSSLFSLLFCYSAFDASF